MSDRNRFRSRFVLPLIAVLALLAFTVTACGGDDGGSTTTSGGSSTTATTAEEGGAPDLEGVELTAWVPPVLTKAQKDLFKRFEQETGATIETRVFPIPYEQNVLTKWATGDRPDLMFWHAIGNWIVQLNPSQNLVDLSDQPFVERTPADIMDSSARFDGTVYAALLNFPTVNGVFYNKDVFQNLDLEPPTTFDELLEMCRTIKSEAPDVTPLVAGGGDQWPLQIPAFMMWNDALQEDPELIDKLNRNEAKFTDPVFVDGIQKFQDSIDQGCYNEDLSTATFTDQQERILDGSAAMTFMVSDFVPIMADAYDPAEVAKKVGMFPLSSTTDVASWQTSGTNSVYVPKTGDEEKEAAATAFLNWATGEGYQQYIDESGQFPILEGASDPKDVQPALVEAKEAFEANSVPQFQQTLKATYGPFETFLSEMVAGDKDPMGVAESLQSEFEKSARQVGLEGF